MADFLMFNLFREVKIRPILAGFLSYLPGLFAWWDGRRPMGNTSSAYYSRGIWRFHLANYKLASGAAKPENVVELGPGATLGTCVAALCDGVNRAIGLDACPYASSSAENLRILKELTDDETPVADRSLISKAITNVGSGKSGPLLDYVAPWNELNILPENSVDLIFSHSVMEHVDSPVETYIACFHWLKPGGIMSHKIDHSSHAITRTWNGHYGIPAAIWRVIFGKRPYLLNRMPPSLHQKAIVAAGFEILDISYVLAGEADNNTRCKSIAGQKDFRVKTSAFVCKKPVA